MVASITTSRLTLVPFEPEAIRSLIAGDRSTALRILGLQLPDEFPDEDELAGFLPIQLRRMEQSPERRGWTARLMVATDEGQPVGHCGFHGPPDVIGRAE